jgi:hypothetical protein
MTRGPGSWRRAFPPAGAVVLLGAGVLVALQVARPASGQSPQDVPPPPDGYFSLRPVSAYASLPGDAAAAAKVHRSAWEPRRGNTRYNHTVPVHLRLRPENDADRAYDPRWNEYVLRRITGHFTGTTDEIVQWAAAKWGLPDNLLRAIAYMESDWRQDNHGDYVRDRAGCLPGYRHPPCPVTFGIAGTKSTSWPGLYPWNRDSTAAAVDVLGGWLRGCYEGWVWWLGEHQNRSRGVYHAGDLWGCVGAWYSGNWHDGPAAGPGGENYILRTQYWVKQRPWLRLRF